MRMPLVTATEGVSGDDALALLAETALHHEIDPGTPGERYQVVVHVDAAALERVAYEHAGACTLVATHGGVIGALGLGMAVTVAPRTTTVRNTTSRRASRGYGTAGNENWPARSWQRRCKRKSSRNGLTW